MAFSNIEIKNVVKLAAQQYAMIAFTTWMLLLNAFAEQMFPCHMLQTWKLWQFHK